jgi:hypothetical protein
VKTQRAGTGIESRRDTGAAEAGTDEDTGVDEEVDAHEDEEAEDVEVEDVDTDDNACSLDEAVDDEGENMDTAA